MGQEENGDAKCELFINLRDNSQHLDPAGFWPFGKVIPGADWDEGPNGVELPHEAAIEEVFILVPA